MIDQTFPSGVNGQYFDFYVQHDHPYSPSPNPKLVVSTSTVECILLHVLAVSEKCQNVHNITFVRGKYDFIAEFELPNFEAAAALKMITMSSGAFSEMDIMEPVDLNQIAKSASSAAGEYKAVGK